MNFDANFSQKINESFMIQNETMLEQKKQFRFNTLTFFVMTLNVTQIDANFSHDAKMQNISSQVINESFMIQNKIMFKQKQFFSIRQQHRTS